MRSKPNIKKLISVSEEGAVFFNEIKQVSADTGLTESNIIENCVALGLACLYKPDKAEEVKKLFQFRYGNIIDTAFIDQIARLNETKRNEVMK